MSDYEVLDTLGKGSFGTVSRIKRKRDGKVRATPLHSCRCFPLLRTFVKVSMHLPPHCSLPHYVNSITSSSYPDRDHDSVPPPPPTGLSLSLSPLPLFTRS